MSLILRLLLLALLAIPAPALASSISFSMTSGTKSATADFARSGSNLVITLTNTSTIDAMEPTDVLTAIFINITGDPALSRISAMVPLTSNVFVSNSGSNVTPGDRVVGGEWAYRHTAVVPPNNGGVSSTGLGVFGGGDVFPGANLQGPASPDGLQYGLTTLGDNLLTGNGGLSGEHLIKNSAVFTLGGFTWEPDAVILAVSFQYGTDLSEPSITIHAPEPGSFALAITACVAAVGVCWRRRVAK